AQWAQTRSRYAALVTAGTPVPRYRYGTPTFYVPGLSGFPPWFVVAGNRTPLTGGKPGAPGSTLTLFPRAQQTGDRTLGGPAVRRDYQWLLQGAPYPQAGLRLAGGGALIMYGMYLNTSNEHPNLVAGPPIGVPAGFAPLLAEPTEVGYHEVIANWAYQFAAID